MVSSCGQPDSGALCDTTLKTDWEGTLLHYTHINTHINPADFFYMKYNKIEKPKQLPLVTLSGTVAQGKALSAHSQWGLTDVCV